jgi:hypothetical protein
MAKLSPIGNNAQFINGDPAVGAKLFFYAAGSSTKQTTYTDEAGLIPQTNPIILDSRGEPAQPIWLTEGLSYKVVFTSSTDSDPPASPIWDVDNVDGINDASITLDQWIASGVTPTYVSATTFTVPGDQTTAFHANRRIKALVTAGTVYGYISASVFGALTTVTVVLDSGNLDTGLSSVQLGLITATNTSIRIIASMVADGAVSTAAKVADTIITPAKLTTGRPFWNSTSLGFGTDTPYTSKTTTVHSTAGTPATSGTADAAVAERLTVANVSVDKGVYASGRHWIQPRATANFTTNFGIDLCPNGGTVGINGTEIATISGTAPLYMCRAWVNFNGTGVIAIRASGNVTSITDNGVGDYTANFTTALPDANYAAVITPGAGGGAYGTRVSVTATSSVRFQTTTSGVVDTDIISVAVFR